MFLPKDGSGIIIQMAFLLLVLGSLLMWIGLLAHVDLRDIVSK
jgi:hypothetical protein